ncbi:MAG TPA: T9SS type A sorting domain-containing protein [Bacteroides sp.]|nr:T9SS type A sorting domain-containing protein [Bacteroides sp.]
MRLKIFTFFLCAIFVAGVTAQDRPTHEVKKVDVGPDVDGVVDELWNDVEAMPIDRNFQSELPTIGASGESFWKMVWVEGEGIYVILVVNDDVFYPHYAVDPIGNSWEYDKPEIYFDCNYVLQDDGGASAEGQPGNGHHQCAPPFEDGKNDGTLLDAGVDGEGDADDLGVKYAMMVNDPDYISEYFFPMEYLTDKDGAINDLSGEVGFDVTIIDRDPGDAARKRAVWANEGLYGDANESWNSMDECGILTFQGVGDKVYVESVSLTGGDITKNNLPLQIQAEVLPEDATNKNLSWSVENVTGRAKINKNGVLTPIADGLVTVKAETVDGSYLDASIDVNISGQLVSMPEINLIRNGYFNDVDAFGDALEWTGTRQVFDGVATIAAHEWQTNVWDTRMDQQRFGCNTTDQYYLTFVAWGDDSDTLNVDFEDPSNDYNRYGTSTHELSTGESEWNVVTDVVPTKYVFDVVFNEKLENTTEHFNFFAGHHEPTLYIDSVILYNENDLALITDYKPVESIEVSADGDAVVPVGGTLQMLADVQPADADYTDVYWSVEPGTGDATIDETGLLTGDTIGTVTVVAKASDDSEKYDMLEVIVTWPEGIEEQSVKPLNIYPNPAVDRLTVELATANEVVSIYNSVGQKIEEVNVSGNRHIFDISSYARGIYFVKTGDTVAKFIK